MTTPLDGLGMVPPNTTGTQEQVAQLICALAKAQGEFAPISKNQIASIRPRDQAKTPYKFAYADLAEVIACTRPALAANGLAIVQPLVKTGDFLSIRTILMHAGGATMWTECEAPSREVSDLKEFGGQYNYLRRYQMQGLLAVASEDDIDEDGSSGSGAHSGSEAAETRDTSVNDVNRPSMARAAPAGAVITPGQVEWIKRKAKSLGMDEAMGDAMFKRLKMERKEWSALVGSEFDLIKAELNKAAAL